MHHSEPTFTASLDANQSNHVQPTCRKRQDVVIVHPELVELGDPCMVSFQILANHKCSCSASMWIRKLLRKKTAAECLDPVCINTIALGLDRRLQHQGKWTSNRSNTTRFEQNKQVQKTPEWTTRTTCTTPTELSSAFTLQALQASHSPWFGQ